MARTLDHIDRNIIHALQQEAKSPYVKIAQSLGVSEGTVRNRIRHMLEAKVLAFTIHQNPQYDEENVSVLVGLRTWIGYQDTVVHQLRTFDAVSYVGVFAGPHDLMLRASFATNNDLVTFLHSDLVGLPGIQDMDVRVELHTYDSSFSP